MYRGNINKVMVDAKKIVRRLREGNVTMSELKIEYSCRYGTLVKVVQKLLSAVEYKKLITKECGHPGKREKRKVANWPAAATNATSVKTNPPSSQYLGVTVKQGEKGPRYYAQISRGGEYKNLGIHNVEELAAAAVQEHIGNHAEAKRLRKIAKQKTDTAIDKLKGNAGPVRFLCSGCGADYPWKPEKCEKCGGGNFEKIQPEGKEF